MAPWSNSSSSPPTAPITPYPTATDKPLNADRRSATRIHFEEPTIHIDTTHKGKKNSHVTLGTGVVLTSVFLHQAFIVRRVYQNVLVLGMSTGLLGIVLVMVLTTAAGDGSHEYGFWERLRLSYDTVMSSYMESPLSPRSLQKTISSHDALSHLSRVSSGLQMTIQKTLTSYRRKSVRQAITRKECFARRDRIEQLSVQDMITLFRYAVDVSQVDFNKNKFMNSQSQLVRSMVTATDMAVTIARGGRAQNVTFASEEKGEVDALYFVAIVRIFAEWRAIRLVPPGYQRYTVGLNLAYRDLMQNLSKIEDGIHAYLEHHHEKKMSTDVQPIDCPSLRQLLLFEQSTKVHPRLPKLTEKSGASGLLWTKRQLHYQVTLLLNSLEVPSRFATAQAAAQAAYSEVYDEYHGWAVKQVFTHSFGGSPPLELIWHQMIPSAEAPDIKEEKASPLKRSDSSENPDNEFLVALEEFGREVGKKWQELNRFLLCLDLGDKSEENRDLLMSRTSYLTLNGLVGTNQLDESESPLSMDDDDSFSDSSIVEKEPSGPVSQVKTGTLQFVQEVLTLLTDVGDMISELNMNDPTRV
eukprot:Nitzschia sp. Nitz4//scaffold78_size91513//82361//84106//NITZ4_004940-RA/size91513-processed-gene-0.76-mRNA-1//1//CDS//3329558163//3926//frame0